MSISKQILTVVVTRYNEPDKLVKSCLLSLQNQVAKTKVIFLDQKISWKTKAFVKNLSNKNVSFYYENIPANSLSFARNYGLSRSKTNLIAFCDVDCILENNWSYEILKAFQKTDAAIVGTKIVPNWQNTPSWWHFSKAIQEFYSLLDLSEIETTIPKVIGASFAINIQKLKKLAYFDENLGRKQGKLLGGEETDLCKRAIKAGFKVVYTPFTYANHQISSERMKLSWIFRRAYYGGLSRSLQGGKVEPFSKKISLLDKLSLSLIAGPYLTGYFYGKIKR